LTQLYLSIIIPVYNEARRLQDTLVRISDYLAEQPWSAELIVVDDGSTDETCAVVRNFITQSTAPAPQSATPKPQVRLIENDHRGKGYTVRAGMLAARGRYILFSDADLATPIAETARLLACLDQGYDIAIGSREGAEARRYNEPRLRRWMGRLFNALVRLLIVGGVKDTQCGFKAFRREAAHDIFGRLKIYGKEASIVHGASVTAFDVEVLYLAVRMGYGICEVPIEWYYREQSKVSPLRDSMRMARDVLRLRWNAWRGIYD
jgi:glycosyltransferase involved in cell wall biosynthesis